MADNPFAKYAPQPGSRVPAGTPIYSAPKSAPPMSDYQKEMLEQQRKRLEFDKTKEARQAAKDAKDDSTSNDKRATVAEQQARIKTALDNLDDLTNMVEGSWFGMGTGSIVGQEAFKSGNAFFGTSGLFNQTANDVAGAIEMVQGDLINQVREDMLSRGVNLGVRGVDTEKEAQRIAASVANLAQTQDEDQFLKGVQRAREYYKRRLRTISRGAPAPAAGNKPSGNKRLRYNPETGALE